MTVWPELIVPVAGLRQRGASAELSRRATSDSTVHLDVAILANSLAIFTSRIPDDSSVRVKAAIDAGISGIDVRGFVEASWEGECRRCLDLVERPLEISLSLTFLLPRDAADDADAYPYDGEVVDLSTVVREELMLALPLSPICSDDCVGEDPDRFESVAEVEPEAPEEGRDPRWNVLSQLSFDED